MQRSIPFAKTTPSDSEARNLAGIVSRFLASRVWSKVPRKAIGHRVRPAWRGWPRTEVEEWEEPLHPGPLCHFYPTSSHFATRSAHLLPQTFHVERWRGRNRRGHRGFRRWEAGSARGPPRACAVAPRADARRVAVLARFRPAGVPAKGGAVGR